MSVQQGGDSRPGREEESVQKLHMMVTEADPDSEQPAEKPDLASESEVQKFLSTVQPAFNAAFPREPYLLLVQAIKRGELFGVDKWKHLACIHELIAYIIRKLQEPNTIGGAGPIEDYFTQSDLDDLSILGFEMNFETDAPCNGDRFVAGGALRNSLTKRALALLVAYAMTIVEDPDKVQDVFEAAIEFVKKNWS